MPCYDKKLEASREDFYNDIYRTRDVDCVISTRKLLFSLLTTLNSEEKQPQQLKKNKGLLWLEDESLTEVSFTISYFYQPS